MGHEMHGGRIIFVLFCRCLEGEREFKEIVSDTRRGTHEFHPKVNGAATSLGSSGVSFPFRKERLSIVFDEI